MSEPSGTSLGRLVAVHPVAPAALQRAVFIAVLSFLFFLGMMFAYYLRQEIGYFLLASAFLLLYVVMMYSLFKQRKSTVEVYENGIRVGGDSVPFHLIDNVSDAGELSLGKDRRVRISSSVIQFPELIRSIRNRMS